MGLEDNEIRNQCLKRGERMKIKTTAGEIDSIVNLSLGRNLKYYFDIEGKWYFALLFPVYSLILFLCSIIAYPAVIIKMLFALHELKEVEVKK